MSAAALEPADVDLLDPLVLGRLVSTAVSPAPPGVVVGEVIGLADEERTPLVTYPGQPGSAAVAARSVVDLHAMHVGRHVVLVFENGDGTKPIILGLLRDLDGWPMEHKPGSVDLTADGRHMVVSAKNQLVLRCGKASITMTNAGKIIIQGTYVSNRSSGVLRIKGGSVQIN